MGNSKSTPCTPKALSPFLLLLGCPQIFVFNSPWIAMFEMQIGFPFTLLYPFSCVRLSVCVGQFHLTVELFWSRAFREIITLVFQWLLFAPEISQLVAQFDTCWDCNGAQNRIVGLNIVAWQLDNQMASELEAQAQRKEPPAYRANWSFWKRSKCDVVAFSTCLRLNIFTFFTIWPDRRTGSRGDPT